MGIQFYTDIYISRNGIIMIILASQSPRRRELLKLIFSEFEVRPTGIDENSAERVPWRRVLDIAERKARAAYSGNDKDIIISADTTVVLDGDFLEKPQDDADARRIIKLLSGRTHTVYTGVCVLAYGGQYSFYEETKVTFYRLSDDEIDAYIACGEGRDKAGAYGIQGKGALLVRCIDGDLYNVIGLPVAHLARMLYSIDGAFRLFEG